jgi:hypothetical protein
MTESERARIHAALACLVHAHRAAWSMPAVGAGDEAARAVHWQGQALAWLLELVPASTREMVLRPIGGRLAPVAGASRGAGCRRATEDARGMALEARVSVDRAGAKG